MGLVPEFISKLIGGKKDVVATPPANNGPLPVVPEASVNTPPIIMDPLVSARPPMPEEPHLNTEPGLGTPITNTEPTLTPDNITSVENTTSPIGTFDSAPAGISTPATTEKPTPATTTTSDQQAA